MNQEELIGQQNASKLTSSKAKGFKRDGVEWDTTDL